MQRYFDVVQNRQGTAVVGATVTVYDSNGNLATLYSNNSNAATSNPVYTNADGEYAFYAANGTYSITIAQAGYATETKPGVVLFDPSDSGASGNVQFLQTGTGAQVRSVQSKLSDVVSVKDFGAVGDGIANDVTAFQAAIDAVLAAGGGVIYIPKGVYWFPQGKKLDPGVGNITFYGDGMDASVLHYHEGTTVPAYTGNDHLFLNIQNITKSHIQFENLQFRGTLNETTRAGRWANPLWLDFYPTITIRGCKFLNIAGEAMDFHKCGYFQCIDSYFKNIAADGIRVRDTSNCFVSGNYLEQLGDDSIALHTTNDFLPTRQGLIITNNRIVNGGAVKCLGGRVVHITNNQLEMLNFWAIEVETTTGPNPEGQNLLRDVIISGNIILDQLSISSASSGVPQTAYVGIQVRNSSAPRGSTGTNNVIPGDYDAVTGAFVLPYPYDQTDLSDLANPVAYSNGLVITDNILRRTRPTVANFSDYGYGKRLFQGVPYDPAITDIALRGNVGISVDVNRNVIVSNNIVASNYTRGIVVTATTVRRAINIAITNNIIFDIISYGILFENGVDGQNIVIKNNLLDCDPYRLYSNSNIDGTYTADNVPRAIDLTSCEGVKIISNIFRNCCKAVQQNVAASNIIDGNILCCAPDVVGFSNTNKGIGVVELAGEAYRYEIIDADPTSATFGNIVNVQRTDQSFIPISGVYVRGAFIRNTSPSLDANDMVLLGWVRLTTGSGHVLGTDWARVYTSHVSPAT